MITEIKTHFNRGRKTPFRRKSLVWRNQSNPRYFSYIRKLSLAAIVVALPLNLLAVGTSQDSGSQPNISSTGILRDYIYGYAPMALQATEAILTAVPDASTPGRAPINQFARQAKLADPSEQLIPRPNADTLYTNAWLDLSTEPIILHVPNTDGRYYLIPMLDAYSNEFASVGSRTTGNGAGNFAIVGPQWQGQLPQGLAGVFRAPTNTVWLIGRTLVHGQRDLAAAFAVTSQYQLVPLHAYPAFQQTGNYTPPTSVPVRPPNPDFVGLPVTSSPGFSEPEFFNVLAAYAQQNPPPADQEPLASQLVADGLARENELSPFVASLAHDIFALKLAFSSTKQNGWTTNPNVGNYGTDYLLRAAVASFGLGANIPADAVYWNASVDLNGNSLDGNNSYVIHFPSGQIPPVEGFWSITVYDQNGFLIPNPIQRYSAGGETGLLSNPDGSVDILLQSAQPLTLENNWLPIPVGSFTLTLRLYWPTPSVLNGDWIVPGVTPALPK